MNAALAISDENGQRTPHGCAPLSHATQAPSGDFLSSGGGGSPTSTFPPVSGGPYFFFSSARSVFFSAMIDWRISSSVVFGW